MRGKKISQEVLAYQPDAVEIEERSVPGRVRWVLYVILGSLAAVVVGAVVFKVDRIVVAQGKLITTAPTIVIQSLHTAVIRSIDVQVGDSVEKGQILATLDSTFASADLTQLTKEAQVIGTQVRRIQAELKGKPFAALKEEGEDGLLQEQLFRQRKIIFNRNKQFNAERIAALEAKLTLNKVQHQGKERQLKLLRDVEGTVARDRQKDTGYRLRLLDAQKNRFQTVDEMASLRAEEQVIVHELQQARSEWRRFIEERSGELMEQQVTLRNELEKVVEEINKAKRLHELVSLRAPQPGVVLQMADLAVGSIARQAEPLITLVPLNSRIEVEVNVPARDIARIRTNDSARVKLDAFPFQRHDTLPGKVRVISEDSFRLNDRGESLAQSPSEAEDAFYRTRLSLLSTKLRNVPPGFRLMPGMKVRTEIKVGSRSVISYFLYPIIRVFDESLREP
ncbi:HlyD family type I secretion periplasmic adaptor subunit [Desulfopila sp. IMCC35006]|uniref:HlyD family type I secretion periplasmic adaptor subunit n=1 Tax=Desulfopila sp. IMCC35006 TaxID=2569542 RepID=UPI0010AB9863|nr:HlyD family type I secretion periplasmic adaptor subunit [Desulfopila sp. IMCC35006]TKB23232.1 HlyD family type I secretion periplasmic adaptor subunit [Desulfopila sp. IMCC35006]